MKTAFSTGPGFYAASTRKVDDTVPAGKMRCFIARIEAYDGSVIGSDEFDKTEFKLLPAMAEGKPEVARALLLLHSTLAGNLELLRKEAKQ